MSEKAQVAANGGGGPSALPPLRAEKITPQHLERLAIVYVRQSTPQQLVRHQESTQIQYSLKLRALHLGWPEDRVVVIDDDQGQSAASAEGRLGFQHVVSEVTLGHVGVILGVETSRLARSCDDWYPLLKVCALFGTLIGDLDGIYDPSHYNDRLLLGLKGTMSEAELHILNQRMQQGRLNKARRGELIHHLPIGYIRRPSGEVTLDPDQQVQQVVRLIFRKFDELGTQNAMLQFLVKHNIQLGIRIRSGPAKGELEWVRPGRTTLFNTLKNPIYAGAYVFGRHAVDKRRKIPGRPRTGRRVVHMDEWPILLKDRFPAYITWEQYERNLNRLQANRAVWNQVGAPRCGPALLNGLLVCKQCSRRLNVVYQGRGPYRYICSKARSQYGAELCQGISGPILDRSVAERVLEALQPAALELSLEAAKNIERERKELEAHWQSQLERATYEAERAGRYLHAVDPENRLVGRQLEREWEEKLLQQKKLQEEYERFGQTERRILTEQEREQIRHMAENLPMLWQAPTTTDSERKEIIRQVIDSIVVDALSGTEKVELEVHWAGRSVTKAEVNRPVARWEQLSYFPQLAVRVRELAAQDLGSEKVAAVLNQEGWRPVKRCTRFGRASVLRLIHQLGISPSRPYNMNRAGLRENEWRLGQLATQLHMPPASLYNWLRRGWLKARKIEEDGEWAIWADAAERDRLETLRQRAPGCKHRQRWLAAAQAGGANVDKTIG